jgi:hypothetical protein
VWLRQVEHNSAHRWLRQAVERAAQQGFEDELGAVQPSMGGR